MGYISDVCPVKEVGVVADLEVGLIAFVYLGETDHDLPVSWAVEEKTSFKSTVRSL